MRTYENVLVTAAHYPRRILIDIRQLLIHTIICMIIMIIIGLFSRGKVTIINDIILCWLHSVDKSSLL